MQAKLVNSEEIATFAPESGNIEAGQIVWSYKLIGVATSAIPEGKPGSIATSGIFDVAKASATTFDQGVDVFFNWSTKLAVTTDGGGGNPRLGIAVGAGVNGRETVRVKLNG